MIPFYFGADNQRLYGVYEAARDGGAVSRRGLAVDIGRKQRFEIATLSHDSSGS